MNAYLGNGTVVHVLKRLGAVDGTPVYASLCGRLGLLREGSWRKTKTLCTCRACARAGTKQREAA
ncbi:hypothetical protein M0R72_17585 [Candidatus Pacearchaeota archaeon]|nr:hypothetical protein [Candidatus Pacearchaeota archaeon]